MSQAPPQRSAGDPLERQLMQQAQVIARLRRDLDDLTNETTDMVAGILARCEDLEARGDDSAGNRPAAWCWRDLGPLARTELMSQLESWTRWLRHRYPLARKIPGCWAEHSELVEELIALWLAWQQAYQEPHPPLTAAADWHDRWLPGLLNRLEHGPFALDCANAHAPRPAAVYSSWPGILETPG